MYNKPIPIKTDSATIVSITNSAAIILMIRIVALINCTTGMITDEITVEDLLRMPLITSLLFRDT